jgi:hypothetical protein
MKKVLIENIPTTGLSIAHFKQLMSYLEDRDMQEWYYGNRKQFKKRHEELRKWVTNTINLLDSKNG